MPKYENVRIANFFQKMGKGTCYIAQGDDAKEIRCLGIISRRAKVKSVAITPDSGGVSFDPPITCEIDSLSPPFDFLICKKGGK